MTDLTIPASITFIGKYALNGCSGLTEIKISNAVDSISEHTFSGCSSLTSVLIPNSVNYIGNAAFSGCHALTFLKIPDTVTTISNNAFTGCYRLTEINVPRAITSMGYGAFNGCSGLTEVYYDATEPIEANSNCFSSDTYRKATLYVPIVALEKCRQTNPWSNFQMISAKDVVGVDEIEANDQASETTSEPCEVYNLNGVVVGTSTENLRPGLYIVRQGGNVKKTVVK